MIQTTKNYSTALFILAAVLLLATGFWNGFPFLYPDDGTYLASGFMPEMPMDRPITYGLFIYATSLGGLSLWGTIGVQALMTSWVIFQVLKAYFPSKNIDKQFVTILLFLTLTSSISFLTSQLMTDCFTPLLLLTQLLLVADAPLSKRTRQGLFGIYFLTTAMHISHVPYNCCLIALYFGLFLCAKKRLPFIKIKTIAWLLGLTLLSIGTMSPPIAKSSHAFRIGSMITKGILPKVLDAKCVEKNWKLCQYRDSMPVSLEDFVWNDNSPLNKIGLEASKKEFNDIIWTSYTTPSLLKLQIKESIQATGTQLQYFSVCEGNAPFAKGSVAFDELERRCPAQTPQYLDSRQAQNQLLIPVNAFNYFLKYFVYALLFGCLGLFFNKKLWSNPNVKLRFFLLTLFLGMFLNAWLCATLVYPTNRYGTKMIWLIHLAFALILMTLSYEKPNKLENIRPFAR